MAFLALVALSSAVVTFAPAYRGLPKGSLIVSYATQCNTSTILREVEAGVNVLVWSSITLGPTPGTVPKILGGPELTCVAGAKKVLDEAGFSDVAHMISIGGWNAAHPNTDVALGQTWWSVFEAWNLNPNDHNKPLFDGIDWDLEGNSLVTAVQYKAPYNTFTVKCLELMRSMSKQAKARGAIVSLMPRQSYFDPSTSKFDRSLLHNYLDYHPEFKQHGMNAYAVLLAWDKDLYDFVDIQLYENNSRAEQAIYIQNVTAEDYLVELTKNITSGNWTVDFSNAGISGLTGAVSIRVPPERLVFGFSRSAQPELFHPDAVATAFTSLNVSDRPRGVMFWNVEADDSPCSESSAERVEPCHAFATDFNKFLQVRQSNVEPADNLLQARSSDTTARDAQVKMHVQLSSQANMNTQDVRKPSVQRPSKSLMREEYSEH